MISLLKELGPLGHLTIALGAAGVVIASTTLALLLGKKQAAKVTGILCLLAASVTLAIGGVGHALAMLSVTRVLSYVPFSQQAEVLLKGTIEARVYLLLAMLAAALPWGVGLLAMLSTRSRLGGALAVLVAAGLAMSLQNYASPLPPGKTTFVQVDGLQLPSSKAASGPSAQPLLALTPDGLWLEGAKVESMAAALEDRRVREQNPEALPLAVDGRVPFSKLVEVLDAAGALKRHDFELLVQPASGDLAAIRVRDAASISPDPGGGPQLNLTLRLTQKQFQVLAAGGAFEPMPLAELSGKLKEIKTAFPQELTVRVTADDALSMDALVAALDVIRETEDRKLLFPDIVIGRFESPVMKDLRPQEEPDLESPEVDREKLAAWVRARRGAIQSCYERELRHDPQLHGKIVVRFSIAPSGRATDLDIEENTLGNKAVATCMQAVIAKWVFPFRPSAAVEVAYPFVFSAAL